MKSVWRELRSKASTACIAIGLLVVMCGCQTWSPSSWGLPTSTRVPPPPTGSYQHQGAYYNNPSTGTPAPSLKTTQVPPNAYAPVVQASAVNPFGSSGSLPTTNMSDQAGAFNTGTTSIGFQAASGHVSTAGYNDNGSGMAEVVTAGSLPSRADFDAGNINAGGRLDVNTNTGEGANLQWTGK